MKTNAFKLMAALFVAALSLGFTSCGDDDDNDGGKTGGSGSDPSGTITANIRNGGDYLYMYWTDEEGYRVDTGLRINGANNFETYYNIRTSSEIVCVGKVSGIGSIKKVPQSGWSAKCAVQPGYGYVLRSKGYRFNSNTERYEYSDYHYVRVYVVDYMEGTSGGIIGATIKYQAPWDVR